MLESPKGIEIKLLFKLDIDKRKYIRQDP